MVRSKDELGILSESFNHKAGSLARAESQRQKLLADVAHELRTPLAVIQANTEGIQDGVFPLDLEQINSIHAETLMLGRLINDLRLLSVADPFRQRRGRNHPARRNYPR
jgi:signal transduction histidine kinase